MKSRPSPSWAQSRELPFDPLLSAQCLQGPVQVPAPSAILQKVQPSLLSGLLPSDLSTVAFSKWFSPSAPAPFSDRVLVTSPWRQRRFPCPAALICWLDLQRKSYCWTLLSSRPIHEVAGISFLLLISHFS